MVSTIKDRLRGSYMHTRQATKIHVVKIVKR